MNGSYIDHHGFITSGIAHESQSYSTSELADFTEEIVKRERQIDELNDAIERRRPEKAELQDRRETLQRHVSGYALKLMDNWNKLLDFESNERSINRQIKEVAQM